MAHTAPRDLDELLTENASAISSLRSALGASLPAEWDDIWLLRFVLSNSVPEVCLAKALTCIEWRSKNSAMLADAASGRPHALSAALAPHFVIGIHGTSLFGEPLMVLRVGMCDGAAFVASAPPDILCEFLMYTREVCYMRCDAETRRRRKLVKTFSIIDAAGSRLSQFNRECADLLAKTGKLSDSVYPQLLVRTVIVHPPSIFQAAWTICKVFVEAKTLDKISVCGGSGSSLCSTAAGCPYAFKRFDPTMLPTFVGGQCQCTELGGCIGGIPNLAKAWPGGAQGPAVHVGARSSHDVVLSVRAAASTLWWDFTVADSSLDVSAWLTPAAAGSGDVPLLPLRRYKSSEGRVHGSTLVPVAGTVTLRFSNAHSFLTGKRVAISARVTNELSVAIESVGAAVVSS
jgi:hypothetical protein